MTAGFALLAASYFGLATIGSLLGFYAVYATGRSMMQSATGHQLMYALVSKWFIRRRAMAISAATLGGYIGGIALPPVTQTIINGFGWREAWLFFGFLTIAMAVLPAVILLRRVPEDLGLLPDGDLRKKNPDVLASEVESDAPTPTIGLQPEFGLTLRAALHTLSFWFLTIMVTVNAIATTGITFHMVPHFSDVGISSTGAATSISFMATGSVASVFLWGFASDRVGPKRMLLVSLATLWVASFLVAQAETLLAAYVGAAIYGVGLAGSGLLSEVVWADFFGRRYLGSIRGATIPFQMVGNASGSLIAAFLFDIRGNYSDAFVLVLSLYGMSAVLLLMARRPRR